MRLFCHSYSDRFPTQITFILPDIDFVDRLLKPGSVFSPAPDGYLLVHHPVGWTFLSLTQDELQIQTRVYEHRSYACDALNLLQPSDITSLFNLRWMVGRVLLICLLL